MAGLMTILLGFLLMLFTPGIARAAATADQDFAARCGNAPPDGSAGGANGVLRCFGFDNATALPRTNGAGSSECWGCDFGIMANNNNPNVPVIDTTTKASGGGAMRYNILAGGGSGSAGSWFTHFGPNKTGQLGQGQGPIYVQWRVRWSPELLVPSNWPGGGGAKVSDITLGDLPACPPSGGDSSVCGTSCPSSIGFTYVIQNNQKYGIPSSYANCGGTAAFNMLSSPTNPIGFENPQNVIPGCSTGAPLTSGCKPFVANEWMTFKVKLGPVSWNAWASPVKVWFGRAGQPLDLIIDCESSFTLNPCTRSFPAQNGWFFVNTQPATWRMGKVYLHPYQTCQDSSICASGFPGSPNATVWYDELVISTQDIADPGAPVTPSSTPTAPTSLRVSGIFATPSAKALSGLAIALLAAALLTGNGPSGSRAEGGVDTRQSAYRQLASRIAKAARTLRRFGLALLLVLCAGVASPRMVNAACTGSTLPALAASMAVNEWCQLATVNSTGLSDVMDDVGEGGYISEFANSAAWDPMNEKFHFIGAHHGTTYIGRHVVYTRSTNAWTLGTWPGGCQSGTASSPCFNHAYDHNAVDPATGNVYWRHYTDGTTVRRGTNQGTTWSTLPNLPANQGQCCLVLKYFPERNGLVWVDPDWGAWLFTPSNNTWTRIADTSQNETGLVDLTGMGVSSTNLTGMYSPRKKVFIVAGQTSVWKLDAAGAWTHLVASPITLGINGTNLATDPVSGDFVVMQNGSSTMRRLNPDGTGSWSTISATVPAALLMMNGPGDGLVNAPITNYGVIMYVKFTGSVTQTWLFKLSPSSGDQRAPTPPTGLNAG